MHKPKKEKNQTPLDRRLKQAIQVGELIICVLEIIELLMNLL